MMKDYKEYITGLRGMAILAVVLFHFSQQAFPGAYLGVDMFFVISGYFLFKGVEKMSLAGSISHLWKKFCRLMPSVSVTVVAAILFSLFVCYYAEVCFFGKMAVTTICGASNLYLLRSTAGYFAQGASGNPFMHTWYLACIIQIYAIYAVVSCLLHYLPRWFRPVVWIGLGVTSLGCFLSQFFDFGQTYSVSHYMTFPRLWEVLAGAAIPFLPDVRKTGAASALWWLAFAGLVFLMFAPHFHSDLFILATVIATMAVIRYTPCAAGGKILELKSLTWLGVISFSVYLVHMPVIVYGDYFLSSTPFVAFIIEIPLSVALGWALYHLVEKRKLTYYSLLFYVPVAALSYVCVSTNGLKGWLPWNSPELVSPYALSGCEAEGIEDGMDSKKVKIWWMGLSQLNLAPCHFGDHGPFLNIGDPGVPMFALIGDSHAFTLSMGLDVICREEHQTGVFVPSLITPFCHWKHYSPYPGHECNQQKLEALMAWLARHDEIKTVFIAQRWHLRYGEGEGIHKFTPESGEYTDRDAALAEFCSSLKQLGKQVVLVAPCPEIRDNTPLSTIGRAMIAGVPIRQECLECTVESYRNIHASCIKSLEAIEKDGLAKVMRTEDLALPDGKFEGWDGSRVYFMDCNHFTPAGSIKYAELIKPAFMKCLKQPSAQTE